MGEERGNVESGNDLESSGAERAADDAGAVSPAFDAKLHADGVTFDGDDATLLRAIGETGSLNAAATELGRSYSRAHKRLTRLQAVFGPLVESTRGGTDGGGSTLTDRARDVLAQFDRLRTEFSGVADVDETVLDGRVLEREGELATVETAAGRLRALAPPDTTAVTVTIRADTVTLHDPDGAPPTTGTSARNRFRGTVVDLEEGESIVSVAVDVGADRPLVALVTARSSRLLDLRVGSSVVVTFKTTATRATPTSYTGERTD